jgi:hypothetical protein
LKLIKAIMIVAILATALSFGACAQRKETVTTSRRPQGLKNLRKALLPPSSLPKQTGATCCERRRDRLKFLKMIVVMAVLVTGLGLGACAQHKEVVVPPAPKGGK